MVIGLPPCCLKRSIILMDQENLYESLRYNIPTDDLTSDQKTFLEQAIPQLDLDKRELIYMLMLHDYSLDNPNSKVVYPYKCKQVTVDKIEIKIDCLPFRFKQILYKFVKLAQESINEETAASASSRP